VQTAYQRRNDLIGNLVNAVKVQFWKSMTAMVKPCKTRLQLLILNMPAINSTKHKVAFLPLYRLVSAERYPELKANQNFLRVTRWIASTENQILTARPF
jgi:LemA protein